MIKRSHVFAVCIGLLYCTSLFGQVGFSLPTYTNTNNGDNLNFPVSVVNFDSVFSIQFVIQWNPDVLEFQSVEHLVNPLNIVDSVCFNLLEAQSAGVIRFRWYTSSSYKTLPNAAAIFTLKMRVVGEDGMFTPVAFTELPPITYYEVVRGAPNQFFNLNNSLLTNGKVTVGLVGSDEPQDIFSGISIAPNPVTTGTVLRFFTTDSNDAFYSVTDVTGKAVLSSVFSTQPGLNEVPLNTSGFGSPGVYYLHLWSGATSFTRAIYYSGAQ